MAIAHLGSGRVDVARFGAKAATLDRLAGSHRVPAGFAVAADATDADVRALVPAAYAELGSGAVAVRSSAIGEDSAGASFAGQHDTLLGLTGAQRVVDAVLEVRASASSAHAAALDLHPDAVPGEHGVTLLVRDRFRDASGDARRANRRRRAPSSVRANDLFCCVLWHPGECNTSDAE